nr:putative ribonuclease H-like domain-containing protein [Tanacetum cinerariifolium]
MMVQAPKEVGKIPTNTHDTSILTQPSSSQPQKKHKSRRKQRKETKVPHTKLQTEEHIPTPSHDPLPTKIKKLKKRVKKLKGKKKRTHGLKRLYKVRLSARVESSEEEKGRMNDEDLFGVNDLDGDEVIVDVTAGKNVEQDATVAEKEVSVTADEVVTTAESVEGITAATTLQISKDDVTLAQTLIEIKAAKPKARGVGSIVQKPSEFRTTSSSQPSQLLQAKDKEGHKQKDFKGKSFDAIKKMFDKVYKRVNTFVAMDSKVMEGSKKTQAEVTEGSSKRAGDEIEQERDYDIWSMRMKQYLTHTDYALWEVIVNDDAPALIASVSGGAEAAIPLKTTKQKISRRNKLKAKSTLLLVIPDEHLLKFYEIKDAKTLCEAIKTRFQKVISQLEIHGEVISREDANLKLLISLPPAWNTHTLIMRNKSDLDTLSMDDLYNNLKVYKAKIKGQSSSSSNSQNVAFVSSENTSSTNEAVNTTHDVSTASSQGQAFALTYDDDVMFSFFANQSNSPQLDNEDLKQIDTDDLKEMDLKWHVAMLTIRVKRFIKKTRRNLKFNGKETVGFDKTKVECYNCHRRGHFARECRAPRSQGNKNGDNTRRIISVETLANALVVTDGMDKIGLGYDSQLNEGDLNNKSDVFENASDSTMNESEEDNNQANDRYKAGEGYHAVPPPCTGNFMPPRPDLSFDGLDDFVFKSSISETVTSESDSDDDCEIRPFIEQNKPSHAKINFDKSNENTRKSVIEQHTYKQAESLRKSQNSKSDKRNYNGMMTRRLGDGFEVKKNTYFVCGSLYHLIKDCNFYENKMVGKSMLNNEGKATGQREARPVWKNAQRLNHQNFSNNLTHPHPRRNFIPTAVITNSDEVPVNTAKQSSPREAASTSTARYVNTAATRPTLNDAKTSLNVFHKSHSPVRRTFNQRTTPKNSYLKETINTAKIINRLMVDLLHLEEVLNGVKFLEKCFFTETKCLVLSTDFKLLDENQVLLKVPRQNNMYSFNLKNVVPSGGFTCLSAKAIIDESSLWHRRLGHINFKTMNKLVRGNLARGLPSKIFENDHSCVARQKGKQHKASRKIKLNGVLVIKPHNKTPCELLIGISPNLDFIRPFGCHVTVLNTLDHLGKFKGKANEGFLVRYSINRGPEWLFNIDSLTKSMNYEPVTAGNQTNDDAGIEINVNAGIQSSDDKDADEAPGKGDEGVSKGSEIDNQESLNINTVGSNDPNIPSLEETGIFDDIYDDREVGAEADTNNVELSAVVSPIPTTRVHKDHPKEQIIGDLNLATQTRRMINFSKENDMVFRNKKDERGIIIRNKARLVAQGYTQEESIDYNEVFAHVARIEAIRLFLAYASFTGFIVYQIDVKSAFLYGIIEEEVYVCQPTGFEDPYFPNKVYKVEKALYGLNQALRAWYETLSTYLLKNRFRRGSIDKTLFIKKDRDDILLVQVKQKDDGIFISHDKYVVDILKKFDFTTVKTASTLMEPNKALIKDAEAEDVDVHLYRPMIRSLMYLTASRPDIMFAVCACARFQITPKTSHLHAVKRIFIYLKGQFKLGFWYPRDSPFDLEAFSDSDYARASLERKSKT